MFDSKPAPSEKAISYPSPGQFWRHIRTGRTLLIHEAAGQRLMVVCVKLGRGGSKAKLYHKPPTRFRLSTLLRNYAPVLTEEVHHLPSRRLPHTRAAVERVLEVMRGGPSGRATPEGEL